MQLPQLKSSLQIIAGTFSAAAIMTTLICCLWPCQCPTSPMEPAQKVKKPLQHSSASMPSLRQFETLWNKPLRRPLVVPATPKSIAQSIQPPKHELPNVQLLGIAVEKNNSIAILGLQQGKIELKRIGETLEDSPTSPKVSAIEDSRVLLRSQNETITLEFEKEKNR